MGNRITNTQRFRASAGNEPAVQQFLAGILQQSSMPLKFRNDVRLAVEELFCNIASYAYGAEGGVVDVTVSIDDDIRFATVILADDGRELLRIREAQQEYRRFDNAKRIAEAARDLALGR